VVARLHQPDAVGKLVGRQTRNAQTLVGAIVGGGRELLEQSFHLGRRSPCLRLDEQGVGDEDASQAEQVVVEAPAMEPAEPVGPAEEIAAARPKRSRSKKAQAAAA
jgi:hypothetical protein